LGRLSSSACTLARFGSFHVSLRSMMIAFCQMTTRLAFCVWVCTLLQSYGTILRKPVRVPWASQLLPSPTLAAAGHSEHLARSNSSAVGKLSAQCNVHMKEHPVNINCPSACPYLRTEPTRLCEFKCVPATSCNADNPLTSYANSETMRCEACLVAGCYRCGSSKKVCAECQEGFELLDGTCKSTYRHFWHILYCVIASVAVFVMWYLIALFRRPVVNQSALEAGLRFRYLSSNRDVDSPWNVLAAEIEGKPDHEPTGRQFHLFSNLRHTYISGIGVMLHYRWMFLVIVWAMCCMVLFMILGAFFSYRNSVQKHDSGSPQSFEACNSNVKAQSQDFKFMEKVYFVAVLFVYIASTIGSLAFATYQREYSQKTEAEMVTMGDFALLAKGFPVVSGKEKVEEQIMDFLRSADQLAGIEVVGVSICWDFRGKEQKVMDQIARDHEILGKQRSDANLAAQTSDKEVEDAPKRSCCDLELRCVDALFGMGNLPCCQLAEEENQDDGLALVQALKTSSYFFVIFENSSDLPKAVKACRKNPLKYFHKDAKGEEHEYDLRFENHDFEPDTVLWDGYGCTNATFHANLLKGFLVIFIAMVTLDIFFYMPYVQYILSYSDVAGMSQGSPMSGTLLGLLITVCNQIIYLVILVVAQSCGWKNRDRQMRFYVVQYTLAVFFNTCLDLATVMILAQGFTTDMALQYEIAEDSTMSAKAVAESPSIQKALYVQLLAYIFPSCLLLPFLCEPIALTFLPYIMGTRLVRSRPEVTHQQAEQCLACNPYDLSRYGDVLVNVMLVSMTMIFTYWDLWLLFLYLLIGMAVIYGWDQVRYLRFSLRSVFASGSMEAAVQYLVAMPCGILGSCMVFRLWGLTSHSDQPFADVMGRHGETFEIAKHMPGLDNLSQGAFSFIDLLLGLMTRHTIVTLMFGTFALHMVLHAVLLNYVLQRRRRERSKEQKESESAVPTPRSEEDEENTAGWHRSSSEVGLGGTHLYSEVASGFPNNWFTVNPVHCLRSRRIYQHSPPCAFFRIGKEYWLERNPRIGLYYDPLKHKPLTSRSKSEAAPGFFSQVASFVKGQ